MGYKLAGFEMLGGVEIDPEMMTLYRKNHHPKYSYLMGVQDFKNIPNDQLPAELFNLDILDGSPPCSSFSMAGSREKAWGEKKKFREGQADQILDDLFFHFIDIANKLKPKVVIAENVKGLVQGNARGYVKDIFEKFKQAGYETQLFLFNASKMGVPQYRERTFFIAKRKDLHLQKLKINFNENNVLIKDIINSDAECVGKQITKGTKQLELWTRSKPGNSFSKVTGKGWFNYFKLSPSSCAPTITAHHQCYYHWDQPTYLSAHAFTRLQTFPDDYDFEKVEPGYVCGMSVPPFMMQRVAIEVAKVLLASQMDVEE